jgi:hypothetical protein
VQLKYELAQGRATIDMYETELRDLHQQQDNRAAAGSNAVAQMASRETVTANHHPGDAIRGTSVDFKAEVCACGALWQ